ncbi:HMG box family protein [Histomonas meleagridis]|uniref:HMG box family protein n=1 Tax=Histomonas meleagridis TaxID=135588 RepID=UPI003559CF58|nr:HMG box family protein [Histomonas meleagridis]KAH0802570.1 HMG box family protein [Histomonas meleagridis]
MDFSTLDQARHWVRQGHEDVDNAKRPPNAFILYSQTMRTSVRQENPSLSNIEVSRILGKMWKEVPSETKLQYKQKAQVLQEEFKKDHPNYTYRKARRKKELNELLTKNASFNSMDPPFAYPPMMAYYQQSQPMMQMQGYPMQGQQMQQMPQIPQMTDQNVPQQQAQMQQNLPYQTQMQYPQQNMYGMQ